MEKIYTLTEVRKILGVTQRTLYRYLKEGTLKAFKIGTYWRVSEGDLEAFIEHRKQISSN